MPHGAITVAPNDERDRLVLRMVVNGSFPISAELEMPQVDELLEKIHLARAALEDRRLSDQGPLAILEYAEVRPVWRASPHVALAGPAADSVALGLEHSTHGWLSFVLPDSDARDLGEWLVHISTGSWLSRAPGSGHRTNQTAEGATGQADSDQTPGGGEDPPSRGEDPH